MGAEWLRPHSEDCAVGPDCRVVVVDVVDVVVVVRCSEADDRTARVLAQ